MNGEKICCFCGKAGNGNNTIIVIENSWESLDDDHNNNWQVWCGNEGKLSSQVAFRRNFLLSACVGIFSFRSSVFATLPFSSRVSVCLCKRRETEKGWKLFLLLLASARGWWEEKVHTLKPPTISEEPPKSLTTPTESRKHFLFYMIINLLLFLTLSQQQHHRHWRSVFSRHTQCFDISHKENFSTLNISFFSGDFFCSNTFSPSQQNFPFSRLMIIKCTTSGSCQIISHLTPHAIGRKRKEKINIRTKGEKKDFRKIIEVLEKIFGGKIKHYRRIEIEGLEWK